MKTLLKKSPPLATGPSQGGNAPQVKAIRGSVMCRNSHTERDFFRDAAGRADVGCALGGAPQAHQRQPAADAKLAAIEYPARLSIALGQPTDVWRFRRRARMRRRCFHSP
jgi:hypothetical protein